MNPAVPEWLITAGFVIAGIAVGALNAIGLLFWLAGCGPSFAKRPVTSHNAAAEINASSACQSQAPDCPHA